MNYKYIKEQRDKYFVIVNQLQHIKVADDFTKRKNKEKDFKIAQLIKENKKKYAFYNNLLKTFNTKK